MPRAILSVNAGSSSVKISIFSAENPPVRQVSAQVAGLTAPPPTFKYTRGSETKKEEIEDREIKRPQDAFKYLLERCLNDAQLKVVDHVNDFTYVCHRVVHGGDWAESVEITEETYRHLTALEDLAPLHNISSLEIIRHCMEELPKIKNVTFFDSSFHQTMPDYVKTYPIDPKVAKSKGLRKYGFHGISYAFIARSVADFLQQPLDQTNIITMHLGSGASICAIKNGRSLETSMGLTPLAGLPGATRSGDIDPCLVFHYTSEASRLSPSSTKEMHLSVAEDLLNKQSGWKALVGTTDFSQIATENPPTDNHRLAFDILVDRVVGFVGNYFVKLGGQVDALVFAGGIGEQSPMLRKAVVEKCRCLQFTIDAKANEKGPTGGKGPVTDISRSGEQPRRTLICETDEEFEMAYSCAKKPS